MLKKEVREMVKYLISERERFKVVFANGNKETVENKGYCWVLNNKAYSDEELIEKMVNFQNNEKKFIVKFEEVETEEVETEEVETEEIETEEIETEEVETEEVENLNNDLFQEDIISYCEEAIERELNIDKNNQSKGGNKMLLKDFLKVFICFNDNEIVIIDKRDGKSYYDLYPPKGIMNRKVMAFYVNNNKIVVRVN